MKNLNTEIIDKIKGLIQYYDLGYVLNNLETLIYLPTPYKNNRISNEKFYDNLHIAFELRDRSEITYDSFCEEYIMRKDTFEYIRKKSPTFCQNMKKSYSDTEYKEYLALLKECSSNISELVKSLNIRGYDYRDLLLKRKDKLSDIIDSKSTSMISFYQDNFVLSELENLDLSEIDSEFQNNISRMKSDLEKRITKYKEFERLYSKKNEIKFKPYKNEEERD